MRPLQSGALDQQSLEDLIEGSLRIRTAEGGITADFRGNEEGGVLQLRTPDGDVTVELKAGDEAGELVIRGEKEMAASVEGGITKVVLGYGAK